MNHEPTIRRIALGLLLFNGVTACLGASGLLQAPSGEHLQYDVAWLEPTPFTDYFWPGIILLVANGIGCLTVAFLTLKRVSGYPRFIMFQGFVLIGWLAAEVLWGIVYLWLQGAYFAVALGLIGTGNLLSKRE